MSALRLCRLLIVFVLVAPACTNVCRVPLGVVERPATMHPHLVVLMPLRPLEDELRSELEAIGPQRIPLPTALGLLPGVGNFFVTARDAELLPTGGEGLRLRITLALQRGAHTLTAKHVVMRLRPRVEGRVIVLALRPADLEALQLTLDEHAWRRLDSELKKVLPAALRPFLDAKRLMQLVSANGYALLRKILFVRLGEVGRLRFELPDIPLREATLTSRARPLPHLRLEAFTSLPVRRGWSTPLSVHPARARLAIAGSALAELANDSMRRGLLPRRYDGKLRPRAQGAYVPRYDWRVDDERPLKLTLTKTSPPCARVWLGAKIYLDHAGAIARVGVRDGTIERVEGAALIRLWVWFRQLWQSPVNKSRRLVTSMKLSLGAHRLVLAVKKAQATREGVIFDVRLEHERIGRSKRGSASQSASFISTDHAFRWPDVWLSATTRFSPARP